MAAGEHPHWLSWNKTTVDGRDAFYGESGSGPVVVFLHGWGLDHKAYRQPLSRLVGAGVRVIAPALPGFGGTPALEDAEPTLSSYGSWLSRFLDALSVRDPVLVIGHSFGGGVAISFAHDHPARARGLVLVNSIGGSVWQRSGSVLRSMAERPIWDWGLHFPADIWPLRQARRVLPVIVGEALPNLTRDPRAFVRAANLARLADLSEQLQELKRRKLPVVVLWGTRDHIITQDSFDQMCEMLGKPNAVTVKGSHSWLIADPDQFGEVMTNVVDVLGMASRSVRQPRNAKRRAS